MIGGGPARGARSNEETEYEYRNDCFDCAGAGAFGRNPGMGPQQELGLWPQRRHRIGAVDSFDFVSDGQDIAF